MATDNVPRRGSPLFNNEPSMQRTKSRRLSAEQFNAARTTLLVSFAALPPARVVQRFGTVGNPNFVPNRVPHDVC